MSAFALNGMVAGGSEEVGCAGILIFLAQSQDTYKEDMIWPNDDQWAVEKWDRFGCTLMDTGYKCANPFTPSTIMFVPKRNHTVHDQSDGKRQHILFVRS